MKEANISINGDDLTFGESMTLRVALESFAADLRSNGLGLDANGKKMVELYLENIQAIRHKMIID